MGLQLDMYLASFLILGVMIFAASGWITDLSGSYNVAVNTTSYDRIRTEIEPVRQLSTDLQENVMGTGASGDSNTIMRLIKSAWDSLRLIPRTFTAGYNILNIFANDIGTVDSYYTGMMIAAGIILVIIAIIYLVMIGRSG